MSNLLDMRTRIKNGLAIQGAEYDDDIDDSIRSALSLYEQRPYWFLEKLGTVTLLDTTDSVALPDDLGSLGNARLLVNGVYQSRSNGGFNYRDWEDLQDNYRNYLVSGQPQNYGFYAGNIYFDKTANADYTIELSYYCKDVTKPQGDTDSSVWFNEGMDLIRVTALAMFKDESQEYGTAANDWRRAELYESRLQERNTLYKIGGSYAR
jgi:hypothetical protein